MGLDDRVLEIIRRHPGITAAGIMTHMPWYRAGGGAIGSALLRLEGGGSIERENTPMRKGGGRWSIKKAPPTREGGGEVREEAPGGALRRTGRTPKL